MEWGDKYCVEFVPAAGREFGKLDNSIRLLFEDPILRLSEKPTQGADRITKLESELPVYKRRVGDYRMFFSLDSKKKRVTILAFRKRDSDTYDVKELRKIAGRQ